MKPQNKKRLVYLAVVLYIAQAMAGCCAGFGAGAYITLSQQQVEQTNGD